MFATAGIYVFIYSMNLFLLHQLNHRLLLIEDFPCLLIIKDDYFGFMSLFFSFLIGDGRRVKLF